LMVGLCCCFTNWLLSSPPASWRGGLAPGRRLDFIQHSSPPASPTSRSGGREPFSWWRADGPGPRLGRAHEPNEIAFLWETGCTWPVSRSNFAPFGGAACLVPEPKAQCFLCNDGGAPGPCRAPKRMVWIRPENWTWRPGLGRWPFLEACVSTSGPPFVVIGASGC